MKIRRLAIIAMMASVAVILSFFEVKLPIFPSFLSIDISDYPALLATFAHGPVTGVIILAIKNLIQLSTTSTGMIGEMANFVIGSFFVATAGIVYNRKHTLPMALCAMASGILLMTIAAAFMNYYVLLPLYARFMPIEEIIRACSKIIPFVDSKEKVILLTIVPFNLFKGGIVSLLALVTYKKLSPVISNKSQNI